MSEHENDMTRVDREDEDLGDPESPEAIMRASLNPQGRQAIAEHMNRANDRSAGRVTPPKAPKAQTTTEPRAVPRLGPVPATAVVAGLGMDPSDPTNPVLGPLDVVEEIVRTTQRYGALANWPNAKKSEALASVTRMAKQLKIADGVMAVARRDTLHARAYRERKTLAREAATLAKHYVNKFGPATADQAESDPTFYAEAVNYLGKFAVKVASIPDAPGEEESTAAE